ncbi:hypothetical protein [Aurantiacibacter sediminis]|uniref:hypothetical protein n=1 Tax=Aurantiacibacter sediminis TaxID=2793064 RepID=UPI001F31782E|nr:hypothetical protein [Aurantiacibacter sediminis]
MLRIVIVDQQLQPLAAIDIKAKCLQGTATCVQDPVALLLAGIDHRQNRDDGFADLTEWIEACSIGPSALRVSSAILSSRSIGASAAYQILSLTDSAD